MDYGQLLSEGARLLRHQRILWLFGLLAVLGTGVSSLVTRLVIRPQLDPALLNGWLANWPPAGANLALWLLLIFVAGLLLWLLNALAEAGLIYSVHAAQAGRAAQSERAAQAGRAVPGRDAWATAWRYLARFIAVDTLLFLPLFLIALLLLLLGSGLFIAFVLGIDRAVLDINQALALLGSGSLLCLLPLLCLSGPTLLLILLFRLLAFRAVVLDNLDTRHSLRAAWQQMRRHPLPILIIAALLWGIGRMVGLVVGLITLPLDFLSATSLLAVLTGRAAPAGLSPLLIVGSLFLTLLTLLVAAALHAYSATVWTLAYSAMREGDE